MLIDWTTVEAIVNGSRLCLLWGPPGTGKTTAAVKAGAPSSVYCVTMTDETPAAELRGHFIPEGDRFVWMDGPAMRAFRNGSRLVIDEIDHASGDALDFLQGLTNDPGVTAMTLPNGETVHPHADFRVVATMNGTPADLPHALRDRFAINVEVDEPHPAALASFPEAIRDAITGTTAEDDDDRRTSLRAWKCYLDLSTVAGVGEDAAAAAVFGHRAAEVMNAIRMAGER